MKSVFGIHMPNEGASFVPEMLNCGFDNFIGLHKHPEWLDEIRRAKPDARILVRWYHEDVMAQNPSNLALEIVRWCYDHGYFSIIPGNEFNMLVEHKNTPDRDWCSWQAYCDAEDWMLRLVRAGRAADTAGKIEWGRPPESPGHSDDSDDLGFIVWRDLPDSLREYDFIPIHTYWPNSAELHSEWFGMRWKRKLAWLDAHGLAKPVYITETNRPWNHDDPADGEAYGQEILQLYHAIQTFQPSAPLNNRVLAAMPFIFAAEDRGFRELTWYDQMGRPQPVVALVRSASKPPLPEVLPPGPPPTIPGDYIARYGEGFAWALTNWDVGDPLQEAVQIATQAEVPVGEDAYAFSHLRTTEGRLLWEKATNRMIFIRRDPPGVMFVN